MKKSLTKQDTALVEWNRLRNTNKRQKMNKIFVDNTKIEEVEGEEVINKNFGKVFAVSYTEEGEEITKQIDIKKDEFFPIRMRMQASSKIMDGDKPMYYIPEVEEYHNIHIMKEGEEIESGIYKDLKEKYQLSYSSVVYVWYDGLVYRWKIGGSGLNWFDIKKEINKLEYPTTFKIDKIEKTKKGTVDYNNITFCIGSQFDVEKAVELYKEASLLFDKKEDKKELVEIENEDKEISIEDVPF